MLIYKLLLKVNTEQRRQRKGGCYSFSSDFVGALILNDCWVVGSNCPRLRGFSC